MENVFVLKAIRREKLSSTVHKVGFSEHNLHLGEEVLPWILGCFGWFGLGVGTTEA